MSSGAKETRLINGAGYVEVTAGAGAMFSITGVGDGVTFSVAKAGAA